jgi:hypothetical protein
LFSFCSYKVFIRKGEVNVSWENFLRPFSSGLWAVISGCTVVMALALQITFEVGLLRGKEQRRDGRAPDWLLASFGAVFCSQGESRPAGDLIHLTVPSPLYCNTKVMFL